MLSLLFIGCFIGTGAAYGLPLEPEEGWVTGAEMDQAVKFAQDKHLPLVFVYDFREGSFHSSAHSYMRNQSLAGFVKVLVYVSAKPPSAFQKVADQIQEPDSFLPVMYFASPDLQVLGFVQSGARSDKVSLHATLAKQLHVWLTRTSAELNKADKCAADGRFNAALGVYRKAAIEDIKNTVLVSKTWEVILTEQEAKPLYFPDLPERMKKLETLAEERLAKATEHYEKQEYAEAKKLLEPMVKDKADFEAVKKAAELLKKVIEAMQTKKD
jgi:hypothetical protein